MAICELIRALAHSHIFSQIVFCRFRWVSVTMPSVEVGTVGGGTHLHGQKANLEMLGLCKENEEVCLLFFPLHVAFQYTTCTLLTN
jgi:hypothetical protein